MHGGIKYYVWKHYVGKSTCTYVCMCAYVHVYKYGPLAYELCSDAAVNDALDLLFVVDVHSDTDLIPCDLKEIFQGLTECTYDHCRVHLLLQEWSGYCQDLSSYTHTN